MWCSCTALGLTDVCRKAVRSFGCHQPCWDPVGCVPSMRVRTLPLPARHTLAWLALRSSSVKSGSSTPHTRTAQASFIKGLRLNPFRHPAKGTSLIAFSHSSPCPREQGSQRTRRCVNTPFQECQIMHFSLPFNSWVLAAVTKRKQNKINQPVWFQSAQFNHQEGRTWQEKTEQHKVWAIYKPRMCDSFPFVLGSHFCLQVLQLFMFFLYGVIGQTHLLFLFTMQICGPDLYILHLFVANSDAEVPRVLSFKANARQNLIPEPDPKATEIRRNILINPSEIWISLAKNTFHRR